MLTGWPDGGQVVGRLAQAGIPRVRRGLRRENGSRDVTKLRSVLTGTEGGRLLTAPG